MAALALLSLAVARCRRLPAGFRLPLAGHLPSVAPAQPGLVVPLHQPTVNDYTRILLTTLKSIDLPCAEVCLEDDGDVEIEWRMERWKKITLSISERGVISFAWYLNGRHGHGVCQCTPEGIESELVHLIIEIAGAKET